MKIKKKIKKKSGSKTEILRNLEAQPEQLVSYKKKECILKFTWAVWQLNIQLNYIVVICYSFF